MQSAQESLAELRAAIRYCENAISAAEGTIESIDFRQQLAKQQAMNKQESTGREEALTKTVKDLEVTNETLVIDNHNLERKVENLTKQVEELKGGKPTMPVIPRDVAIAIFREGQRRGYNAESVTNILNGLCEREGFECRIHGIDDIEKS